MNFVPRSGWLVGPAPAAVAVLPAYKLMNL